MAIQTLLPTTLSSLTIIDDATLALEAAHGASSGALLLAGTGSIVLIRTRDGQTARAGGWGHILGDEGGGYAIGRAGLRALTEAMDGGTNSRMTAALAEHFELHTPEALIQRVYRSEWPLQDAAPIVVQAAADGDRRAAAIVNRELDALLDRLQLVVRRHPDVAPRATLVGGLSRSSYYAQRFAKRLRTRFSGWVSTDPETSPVEAALRGALAAGS
jgi:N-acetylglucosamine kinase-like BadF-type ATPase